MDYYLVKKDCYNLLFCKVCWENIESEHAKRRDIKFDREFYCHKEIIEDLENPELEH